MSNTNKALFFKQVPSGLPKLDQDIAVQDSPIDLDAQLEMGSVLIKVQYISLDPYMRGRLRDSKVKSYAPAFEMNKPMNSRVVGKIVKSENAKFPKDSTYVGFAEIANYSVVPEAYLAQSRVIEEGQKGIDLPDHLGALGMPGLTAYSSFYDIGQPQKGETIFVSAASGAVGQLVVQLAKHEGLKVIGSVGDDKKVKFLKEDLGCDIVFNYKKESAADAIKRLAPEGLDIFYDNVGGETLDAALGAMKEHGRVIGCGQISQYNLKPDEIYGIKNLMSIVTKRLTIRGFIVGDKNMGPKYAAEHQKNVSKWLADGSFKTKVDVVEGIENAGKALLMLFNGENQGKLVVKVD